MNNNVSVLSDICNGNMSQIKSLKYEDPSFHWCEIYYPKTKETCLHKAAQFGHVEIVDYLLTEFSPKHVDIRNIDNKTPLHEGAQFGKLECVKMLLQHGAEINAIKRSDWTPLMLACTKEDDCYVEIVQYLLDKGAILNFQNKDGWTSLHIAARNSNPSFLKMLLNKNVNVNVKTKNQRNALHIAALHGNLKNVELLISHINPNEIDSSGNTSFHEAVLGGELEVVNYLIKKGANINVSNNAGANALHLAAGQGLSNFIHLLVNTYGFDVNTKDSNGYTPLHYATRKGNYSEMKILIELGSDIHQLDHSDKTAYDYFIKCPSNNL
ncbi:hypothetical protein WA026_002825 [Henosepilachna vigintioctopunctata]|uniref:Ankyrin repeat domain-containing protein 16 n=1 Tax=Henosepilachna vigintioctopunctata TaxID=420089 RepID=A0AAW1U1H7_9CUCU